MAQLFSPAANNIARIVVFGVPVLAATVGISLGAFYRSSYVTGAREILEQPVPFSHAHHSGQLGIDCRYCHNSVEVSHSANVPATKVCMNCHQQMWTGADLLGPVRDSWATDRPIQWKRLHNMPHYVYFNHSIHLAKGVGCQSCHGRLDQMHLTFQTNTLLMEWCLDCHRNPEKHLRPLSEITSMTYKAEDYTAQGAKTGTPHNDKHTVDAHGGSEHKGDTALRDRNTNRSYTQSEVGEELKKEYQVRDSKTLTNCSICHR